jgi:aliphatic nitrilase
MVLDPSGQVIGGPLADEEGIVYAEIDTALSVEPKQFHDVVGYYNRFDIFDFRVDRSPREPASFRDHPRTERPRAQGAHADEAHETANGRASGLDGAPDTGQPLLEREG